MTFRVELLPDVDKYLSKLDTPLRSRIINFLFKDLPQLENPRSIGEPLKGKLGEFWKYRRGDFRIIGKIEDAKLLILVVKIGDRKNVYKKQ
jgi:mRNA interferase RelE/StbE